MVRNRLVEFVIVHCRGEQQILPVRRSEGGNQLHPQYPGCIHNSQ